MEDEYAMIFRANFDAIGTEKTASNIKRVSDSFSNLSTNVKRSMDETFGNKKGKKAFDFSKVVDLEDLSALGRKYREAFSLGQTSADLKNTGIDIPWHKKNLGEFEKAYKLGYDRRMDSFAKKTANAGRVMKWFKVELLGTMFFLQNVSRVMFGLLKPAADVFSVFELWNNLLLITFVPIMGFLMENILLPLFNLFINLPEPVKFIIGFFVVLVAIFATLGAAIAGIGLGLPAFIAGMALLGVTVNVAFGLWLLAIMAIIAVVATIINYWGPIKQFFVDIGKSIGKVFTDIGTGISDAFKWAYDKVTELWKGIGKVIFDSLPKWLQTFLTFAGGGINAFVNALTGGDAKKDNIAQSGGNVRSALGLSGITSLPGSIPISSSSKSSNASIVQQNTFMIGSTPTTTEIKNMCQSIVNKNNTDIVKMLKSQSSA